MVKCSRKTVSLSNLWVSSNDKLTDFYTSSWQSGDSPVPLLVLRGLVAAVAVAILTWALYEGASKHWLLYLTNWGMLLVTAMMLCGVAVSIMAVCKSIPESGHIPWYVGTYWFLYNVSVSIALLITALYWILLYDPGAWTGVDKRMFWLDVATHGLNSCIAVAEVLLSRTPVRLLHIYQPLGVGMWYAAFTAIYFAFGGKDPNGFPFIYEILDWRQGKRAGIIVGVSAACLIIVYLLLWAIAICRDKFSTAMLRTTTALLNTTPIHQDLSNRFV